MKLKELISNHKIKGEPSKMQIFDKIDELTSHLAALQSQNKTIGFVPTMGALHEGHLSLVRKAREENDFVVVSIFVNPTQFNNANDLKNYPRSPDEDRRMLNESEADILFSPSENEIYNESTKEEKKLVLGKIAEVMEGEHRPGHFDGVVQIVSKLFDIVQPGKSYFGEKDFQQLTIIRFMVEQLKYPVEIIACPTVREKSGLAMSSRNLRLSEEGRKSAATISKTLFFCKENKEKYSPEEIKKKAIEMIEQSGKLKVEYVEIADAKDLVSHTNWNDYKAPRIFAAVFCEGIRLIDNVSIL